MVQHLQTHDEVISFLGGFEAVKELTRRKTVSNVSMWKLRKRFPPDTYIVMTDALAAKGAAAPPALWGMAPAQSEAAAT